MVMTTNANLLIQALHAHGIHVHAPTTIKTCRHCGEKIEPTYKGKAWRTQDGKRWNCTDAPASDRTRSHEPESTELVFTDSTDRPVCPVCWLELTNWERRTAWRTQDGKLFHADCYPKRAKA